MRLPSCFVALALAVAALPARADVSVGAKGGAGAAPEVVATLERTGCLGTCPIYTLTIYSDGRVAWDGRGFVKTRGQAEARIDASALARLRQAFAAARYFELRGNFNCYEATDNPSANTSYHDGTRSRAIQHYYGCRSPAGVDALTTLEARIDQIAGTVRWAGTPKERERLRAEGKFGRW